MNEHDFKIWDFMLVNRQYKSNVIEKSANRRYIDIIIINKKAPSYSFKRGLLWSILIKTGSFCIPSKAF